MRDMRRLLLLPALLTFACEASSSDPLATGAARLEAPRWNDVRIDAAARALLRDGSRMAADRAPVPVLVPRALADKVTVMSEERWAAVHVGHQGQTITLHATSVAFVHPELPAMQPTSTVRGAPAWITQNEAIWSASWSEHGVAYTLELECARPDDARCATDATLLRLANDLVAVGGREVTP